jgi:hypothetical protein
MENAREFANRLLELLRNERHAMAEFLIALAEFDRRNLYRELGHATLFSFLRVELKLSAGAAQYRKTAAELVQRFPEVEAALRDGRVCFSAVIQIAKVLTPENCAEVLPRFFGLSARDATFVAVSIRPVESAPRREVLVPSRPAVAARTIEVVATGSPDAAPLLAFRTSEVATDEAAPEPAGAQGPASLSPVPTRTAPPKPSSFEPLDGEHGRMHLNVSMRLHRKIEEAKHGQPGATLEEVFETALDALLTQRAKRRGIGVKPGRRRARRTLHGKGAEARRLRLAVLTSWQRGRGWDRRRASTAPFTRLSFADRAAPVSAHGTGPRPPLVSSHLGSARPPRASAFPKPVA